MTPDMVTEVLRNLYNASGGTVPPTAVASAIAAMMWNERWQDAWSAAGSAYEDALARGGSSEDVSEAFNNAFADSLGWTRSEFDIFLRENSFTPDGASKYEESADLWEWMANRR